MTAQPIDLYTLLGVSRRATTAQIEAAYTAWTARADAGEAIDGETWERVRYAHEVLSNPQRRSLYDSLVAETSAAGLDVTMTLSASRLAVMDTPQVLYALITLAPQTQSERQPLNIGLVVDRSTSMRGERLEKVIAAAELLLDKLGPEDALSLVSFSDRAEVVLPARVLGATERAGDPDAAVWHDPRRRLQAIAASGGTEIYQGLRAGLSQVMRLAGDGRTSHLILMTDGHTYGDAEACLRLAEEATGHGVGITALGLGSDWNDSFLDALVAPSGGHSHFVQSPGDALPYLEERLNGLGDIHARNVRLRRAWPAQLTLRGGFRLTPFPQPLPVDADTIPLGDLEGRASLSILLDFLVAPLSTATRFRLAVEACFTRPDGSEETIGRDQQLVALGRESGDDTPPAPALIEAARRLNLYRMQEAAWEDAQSGRLDTAATRMRRLTARYLETGDLRLAKQAQLEAQHLTHLGTMSLEGRKVLKYGTRSLLGQINP